MMKCITVVVVQVSVESVAEIPVFRLSSTGPHPGMFWYRWSGMGAQKYTPKNFFTMMVSDTFVYFS